MKQERAYHFETVGQLTGGVAHDFKHILGIVKNYLTFIERDLEEGAPIEADLSVIRSALAQGEELAKQLSLFAQGDKMPPHEMIFNDVIDTTLSLLQFPGIDVISEQNDRSPVLADPNQIRQVLISLALNARDAMENGGGTLTLRTERGLLTVRPETRKDWAWIHITDTGRGMSKETQDRATDPFFTTKAEGTGLGLSTVLTIIAQYGGRLEIDSKVGRGTTVSIGLPIMEPTSLA